MAPKKRKSTSSVSRRSKRLQCYEYIKQGYKIRAAERAAGLYRGGASYLSKLFNETGDVDDRPRSGRPRTYTPEVLDKATQVLLEDEGVRYTATAFTAELCSRHIIKRPYKTAAFMRRWTAHVKTQGHSVRTRDTRTIFLICKQDMPQRVAFAKAMLQHFKKYGLNKFVCVDETTKLQSPHPNSGKPGSRARPEYVYAL